jgi:PAS domain S-box-containing protein
MSPNVVDVMGYSPEELLQEPAHFPRLVHPDDVERVVARLEATSFSGEWDDSYRVIARDGSVRWLQAHGWRTSGPGENPERWSGVTIDVTHLHAETQALDPEAGRAQAPR